ncbi:MAG: helix-turn-helix domain-containing protein [Thermoplasmata archaeon]|nr:helix-turn-helix domain-containing protein [Thermoplasmata archaeon]
MEDEALELENRRRIYQLLTKYPGMYLREMEKKLGLAVGVLEYNLNYMEKKEILMVEKDGNRVRYFIREGFSYGDKAAVGLLRQEIPRRIVIYLMLHENASFQDVLAQFKISKSTLSFHIKKLTEANIVGSEKDGRATNYRVLDPENTARVFLTYKASFLDSVVDRFAEVWGDMGK